MPISYSPYLIGRTASISCLADPRFSYCLHVPSTIASGRRPKRLLLAIHGTDRGNQQMRDLFSDFAEATNTLVVAPLFPVGLTGENELDDYKFLRSGGVAFDRVALTIMQEVAQRYEIVGSSRFHLFGFSGGGHFAHRFLYAHPHCLSAVCVGAPGSVTLPLSDHPWWVGLADFQNIFGHQPDWAEISRVPVHLAVGENDTNTDGIIQSPADPHWMPAAQAAGANRVERLRTLYGQLQARDCRVTFDLIPAAAHSLAPIAKSALGFFQRVGADH